MKILTHGNERLATPALILIKLESFNVVVTRDIEAGFPSTSFASTNEKTTFELGQMKFVVEVVSVRCKLFHDQL